MKKIFLLIGIAAMATPLSARADITTKMSSSVQLQVNAAATQMERIGSSFSISGSNIDTTDGTTAGTVSVGTITSGVYAPGTIAATQDTAGAAFSFSQSYVQADAVATSAPTVGTVGNFSSQVSTAAGAKDTLAGTITSAGVTTITAGGAGTVATGQFVSEVTVN
tara:strand:- start:1008 stop:1502 length:495 start_codon:yes stop_codon:yes gene_type:complete